MLPYASCPEHLGYIGYILIIITFDYTFVLDVQYTLFTIQQVKICCQNVTNKVGLTDVEFTIARMHVYLK